MAFGNHHAWAEPSVHADSDLDGYLQKFILERNLSTKIFHLKTTYILALYSLKFLIITVCWEILEVK